MKPFAFACLLAIPGAVFADSWVAYDLRPPGYTSTFFVYGSNASWQVGFNDKFTSTIATIWNGSPSPVYMYLPPGYVSSQGVAAGTTYFFGSARNGSGAAHAFRYKVGGPTLSLHPAAYTNSYVGGADGDTMLVGSVSSSPTVQNAYVWTGPSLIGHNIHPAGFVASGLYGVNGSLYGGYLRNSGGVTMAALWMGTAGAHTVVHPSGYGYSIIRDVSPSDQVGSGHLATSATLRAVRWFGSAASAISLHPAGFAKSEAYSSNGSRQVGYVELASGQKKAFLWRGTAASTVNLGDLLPALGPGWTGDSQATTINTNGDVAGHAFNTLTNRWHPILWKREP